jgi:hypothetical protein
MKIFLIRYKLSIKNNLTYDKIYLLKRHRIRQKIVHTQNQKLFLRNWRGAERRLTPKSIQNITHSTRAERLECHLKNDRLEGIKSLV